MKNLFPTQSALAALRNRQVWERVLKNKIPRQGTEMLIVISLSSLLVLLKNKIPRQGTEIVSNNKLLMGVLLTIEK